MESLKPSDVGGEEKQTRCKQCHHYEVDGICKVVHLLTHSFPIISQRPQNKDLIMSDVKQIKVTEPWLKTSCGLGEAPFWDKKSNTLRFLDIIKKQLHVVDLNQGPSSHKTIDLPFSIGTTANIEGNDDEFIFGGKEGYGIANKKTGEPRYIKKFWSDEEVKSGKANRMRSNDGSVDSQGRYYVGTMNDPTVVDEPGPEGELTA